MIVRVVLMRVGMLWLVLDVGGARYINDIHGNTVVQDKSSGFHVFELHGFSVGITSSIFMGIALLICATYLALKLGLGRLLQCCCIGCRGEQPTQAQAPPTPAIMLRLLRLLRLVCLHRWLEGVRQSVLGPSP